MTDKGKKQEKKKDGAQSSSGSHKAGIQRTFERLSEKRLRHILKRNGQKAADAWAGSGGDQAVLRRLLNSETIKRQLASRERRAETFVERREARRAERRKVARFAAEAAAAVSAASEKKAKRSLAAKKAAATRKANRAVARPRVVAVRSRVRPDPPARKAEKKALAAKKGLA